MSPELKNTWTPAINVLTWFMLVTAILSVLTRLGTKYFIFRKWTFDDGLVTTSLVLCIAQSIAISIATANGLGQHLGMLSDHKIETVMKVWMRIALYRTIANALNKGWSLRNGFIHRQYLLLQTIASVLHSQPNSRIVGSPLRPRVGNIYWVVDYCQHSHGDISM